MLDSSVAFTYVYAPLLGDSSKPQQGPPHGNTDRFTSAKYGTLTQVGTYQVGKMDNLRE